MAWKTLDDMELAGKRVLTRVDINVPLDNGQVTDATRITRIVPTINDILSKGGTPILLAHFGRPKGKPNPEMSLRLVQPALEEALGRSVTFMERPSREEIDALPADAVVLVENTRFTPMEEANDPQMAGFLASLGDVFCNDAFSAAHRAHASTTGVAHLLPSCAGRLKILVVIGVARSPVIITSNRIQNGVNSTWRRANSRISNIKTKGTCRVLCISQGYSNSAVACRARRE